MGHEVTWNAVMDKIRDAMNKELGVLAVELGSDGQERYGCPICNELWYGKTRRNYCCNCGHKMIYGEKR